MDNLEQTNDLAAQWLVRRTSARWSEEDESTLNAWLAASPHNAVAFLRLQALWREADKLKVLGAGFKGQPMPRVGELKSSPFFKHLTRRLRRREMTPASGRAATQDGEHGSHRRPRPRYLVIAWGVAASVVVALTAEIGFQVFNRGNIYSTPVGGLSAVPLADGSKITLNTDSQIRVALTDTERQVDLNRGEAFFEVAPDNSRPFVVYAGEKRIAVLGTKFSVRRDRDAVEVVVTEGKVAVGSRARHSDFPRTAELTPGNVAHAAAAGVNVETRSLSQAEELLSWRSGYLVFHETPLSEAAAEFNRYNLRKIVIDDPNVATLHVSGNFRADNVQAFAQLLQDGFPVMVSRSEDRVVLAPLREKNLSER